MRLGIFSMELTQWHSQRWGEASLVPRPPRPAFVACSTKSEVWMDLSRDVCRGWCHVSLSFPWIQFVLSVPFVLRVWLLLDRLW